MRQKGTIATVVRQKCYQNNELPINAKRCGKNVNSQPIQYPAAKILTSGKKFAIK